MLRLSGTEQVALRACLPPVSAGRLMLDSTHPAVAGKRPAVPPARKPQAGSQSHAGPDAQPCLFAGATGPL